MFYVNRIHEHRRNVVPEVLSSSFTVRNLLLLEREAVCDSLYLMSDFLDLITFALNLVLLVLESYVHNFEGKFICHNGINVVTLGS